MSGKGDRPRPGVYSQEFRDNFDRIFGERKKKKDIHLKEGGDENTKEDKPRQMKRQRMRKRKRRRQTNRRGKRQRKSFPKRHFLELLSSFLSRFGSFWRLGFP